MGEFLIMTKVILILALVSIVACYGNKTSLVSGVEIDSQSPEILISYSNIVNEFRLVNRFIRMNNLDSAREHLFRAEDIFSQTQLLSIPEEFSCSNFSIIRYKISNSFRVYNYSGLSCSLIPVNNLAIEEYEYFTNNFLEK